MAGRDDPDLELAILRKHAHDGHSGKLYVVDRDLAVGEGLLDWNLSVIEESFTVSPPLAIDVIEKREGSGEGFLVGQLKLLPLLLHDDGPPVERLL